MATRYLPALLVMIGLAGTIGGCTDQDVSSNAQHQVKPQASRSTTFLDIGGSGGGGGGGY